MGKWLDKTLGYGLLFFFGAYVLDQYLQANPKHAGRIKRKLRNITIAWFSLIIVAIAIGVLLRG